MNNRMNRRQALAAALATTAAPISAGAVRGEDDPRAIVELSDCDGGRILVELDGEVLAVIQPLPDGRLAVVGDRGSFPTVGAAVRSILTECLEASRDDVARLESALARHDRIYTKKGNVR